MEKLVASSCNHVAVVEAIVEGRELVNQLRALLLPSAGHLSELAGGLFEELLQSLSVAISMLRAGSRLENSCSPADSLVTLFPSDESKSKNSNKKRENREVGDKGTDRKRSRRIQHTWPTETCIPHYDGHQWRKYGQKNIRGSKYPRNYFKCTFRDDQGCQAKKTVQQKDDGNPPTFIVTYDGPHSCKPTKGNSPIVITDSSPGSASNRSFDDNSLGRLEGPAELVTTTPAAGTLDSCEAIWNAFSNPGLSDGSLELINDDFSWMTGFHLF